MKRLRNQFRAGFSLIQLLLGIAIGAILIGAVVLFTTRGFGIDREQFEQVRITEEARLQLERMSDTIRNAQSRDINGDGFASVPTEIWLQRGDANEIIIFGDVDNDEDLEKIRYALSGTNLIRAVTDPFDAQAETEQVVASSLRNEAKGQALFRYFYRGSDVAATTPVIATGSVDRVGINLIIDVDESQRPDAVQVETIVVPRESSGVVGVPILECADGLDNDGDDKTDFKDNGSGDLDCTSANDDSEESLGTNPPPPPPPPPV